MKNKISIVTAIMGLLLHLSGAAKTTDRLPDGLEPLTERVNIQKDSAALRQIIDGEWVATGIRKDYAICRDSVKTYKGRPSYRFELREDDNRLKGYDSERTKGRAELSWCYAVSRDFRELTSENYETARTTKSVYHRGKGICPQGSSVLCNFAINVPSSLSPEVSCIFAQWHGMPTRTLVRSPEGVIKRMSGDEFMELCKEMTFKDDKGYDKTGNQPNGWHVEQGGYPPLEFGFSRGYFYVKTSSDRKWMSDNSERCNANVATAELMKPVTSEYKAATVVFKMPFEDFPKDRWVSFTVNADWTEYGAEEETVMKPGHLDIVMSCVIDGKAAEKHIVDNEEVLMGRNDDEGYYFKFGIYRVASSTVPVIYNLAGYTQTVR